MAITHYDSVYDPATQRYFTDTTNPKVTQVGLVLRVYTEDYRAMSDVYTLATMADVWSDEQNRPVKVCVNANFECDVSGGHAEVDATPEVLTKFNVWKAEVKRQEEARRESERLAREEAARNAPSKGKKMVVASGRKVPKGTVGVVAYVHPSGRVLLKDEAVWQDRNANGVWVDSRHLKALNP